MKILVIQLARLGDIYQTWPTLAAIKRNYPEAQIDLLVRNRFAAAASECPSVDRIIKMSTADILSGIIIDNEEEKSLKEMSDFCDSLRSESYNKIINLSFSPFSSYLVASITSDDSEIFGYTRFSDGYLCIPDDVSAYFYAQVGINKKNRAHVSQVFSGVAGVDLQPEDWNHNCTDEDIQQSLIKYNLSNEPFILIQVGTSQEEKTYSAEKWSQVLNHFKKLNTTKIVLVGSKEDSELVKKVIEACNGVNLLDLSGQTQLNELMHLTAQASLVVCADSLLLHMASLTNTQSLNISMKSVNFWETGPLAKKSRIIFGETKDDIASDRVAYEMNCMLEDKQSGNPVISRVSYGPVAYEHQGESLDNFSWQLIEAIYMQGSFPVVDNPDVAHGIKRLNELAELAVQQLSEIDVTKNVDIQMELLSQIDTMLEIIPKLVPALEPLVAWFQTERVRIGPFSVQQVLSMTKAKFSDLKIVTDLYMTNEPDLGGNHADTDILP